MKKSLTEQIVHIQNDLDVVFDEVVKLEKRLVSNSDESSRKALQLEKRLEIATKALEEIKVRSQRDWNEYDCMGCARKALYDIEMEGVK